MEKKFSEFKIGDLFDIKKVYGLPMSSYDKGNLPYITGTKENNGVVGFVNAPEKAVSAGNCIAIDPISGISYYQPDKFVGRGFSGASINLLYHNKLNELNGIYICSAIQKTSCKVASYANLFNSSRLKNALIKLPVKTVIIPDFNLMSEIYLWGGIGMSKIDTSAWREFKLDDLFEKINVGKIFGKANDFPTEPIGDYTIPLLTAGIENHGLARYAKRGQCPTILKNAISISANGANTGATFYHDEEFTVLQDAYAIKLKNMEIPDKQTGLFLASCIRKVLHGNFSWTYKAGWERVKDLSIKIPVKETEEIDWDYMAERIVELEQERIVELDNYLKVTGLDNYELTDRDKEVLCKISGKKPEDYDETGNDDGKE